MLLRSQRGLADLLDGPTSIALQTWPQLRAFLAKRPAVYPDARTIKNKVLRWSREITPHDMDTFLNARHGLGHVTAIEVVSRGVSGRVRHVRFLGSKGQADVRGELRVRRLLGNLRSGMFIVDALPDVWRFTGGAHFRDIALPDPGEVRAHRDFDRFEAFFDARPDLARPGFAQPGFARPEGAS